MSVADQLPRHELQPSLTRGHIPSLDGLRGFSVLLIIWHHIGLIDSKGARNTFSTYFSWRSRIGVDVFFVISGFIITILLLRETDRSKSVDLIAFYKRRARRILPAFIGFVIGLAILTHMPIGIARLTWKDWLAVVTFMVDFHPTTVESIHLWTLSVEEHFYLIYPALFLFGKRAPLAMAFSAIFLMPIARFAAVSLRLPLPNTEFWTFTRADSMAYGCCLAFITTSRHACWLKFRAPAASVVSLFALAAILANEIGPNTRLLIWYRNLFVHSVDGFAIATFVWCCILHPRTIGWIFNTRIAVSIGLISYSVYLWQQPFTNGNIKIPLAANLAIATVLSLSSYFLIERPFLRRRPTVKVGEVEIAAPPASLPGATSTA